MAKTDLCQQVVNRLFYYADGSLYWRERERSFFLKEKDFTAWNNKYPNVRAGTDGDRYRFISTKTLGRTLKSLEHRIIWILHHGDIPLGIQIDHRNRKTFDNRLENLRLATCSQNLANKPPKSGFKGVSYEKNRAGKKKWKAGIKVNGKSKTIARFDNPVDAAIAYDNFAIKLFNEFAFVNFPDIIRHEN